MNFKAAVFAFIVTLAPILLIEYMFGFLEARIGEFWPFLLLPWFCLMVYLTRKW